MLRHLMKLLFIAALLLVAAVLGLERLGWLNRTNTTQQAPATPEPVTQTQPNQTEPNQTPLIPTPPAQTQPHQTQLNQTQPLPGDAPVPVKPADPISLPEEPAEQVAPSSPAVSPAPEPHKPPPVPTPATPPHPSAAPPEQKPARTTNSSVALTALNAVRTLAGLPGVKVEPKWQAECGAHATYLTVTDTGSHSEDPSNPHYTRAGANCAHGHYYVTMRPEATAQQAVTYWQNGPFHLPQLIDPRLTRAALAVKHDAAGDIHTAAVLDVKRGRQGTAHYPVKFPRPGSTVTPQALSQFEYPDALPGCPGFTHPAGAPIALLLGQGQETRQATLTVNDQTTEVCLLTAQTFTGATPGDTGVGRSVLAAQGVAVVIPRRPLPAAAHVTVHFQTATGPVSWSFHTR